MKKNLLSGIWFVLFFLSLTFNAFAISYNEHVGTLSPGNTITRTGSTVGQSNVFGNGSPDYVYMVYISAACTLEVNTCGCGWDSYLWVLNSSDGQMAYNDDACSSNASQITGLSIPSAGYYYIVVDGYSSNNSGAYTLTLIASGGTTTLSGGTISIGTTSVSPNSSPGSFTNSVSASGGTGSYSYQWQQSADSFTWTNIGGQTAAYYTVPALTASTYYRRMVTSGSYTAYSNAIFITVIPPTLSGGTISISSSSVCSGSSPGTIANSVSPSGGTGSYTYQWYQSPDNSNWSVISGAGVLTFPVPNLTSTTYFRRLTLSGTLAAYSNTVVITVTSCGGSVTSVNSMTGAVTLGLSASASGTQRTIGITGGTGVTIDVADNDNSPTNEIQSLSVSGSTLSISGGNSVTLPTATYPAAGIALSTGSGWGSSVTNNSANWNLAYSWGNHAGLYRPISYVPAWSEVSSKPTTVSGYGITDAMTTSHAANSITSTNIAAWNAKQGALTITTNGTSGAATLSGNTLNIPQYSGGSGGSSQWTTNTNGSIQFTGGNVGIGNSTIQRNLSVFGTINAKEVNVSLTVPAPDYVFEKSYHLTSLVELETYLESHKHLPGIPSAKEMEVSGVNLSEINMLLLKKVEELTLYVIEQQKQIEALKNK